VNGIHQYAVVRYVPNPVRDEAVNVGVIVRGHDGSDFAFRFLPRGSALRKLWPSADQQIVRLFEQQLKSAQGQPTLFDGSRVLLDRFGDPRTPEFFEMARLEFVGNLQITPLRAVQAPDLAGALHWAWDTFVKEPEQDSRPINYQQMAPAEMRQRLWRAFERREATRSGVKKQQRIDGMHAPWTFDLAYRNGKLNVINSLALDHAAAETNLGRALVYRGMVDDVRAKLGSLGATAVIRATRRTGPAPLGSDQAVSLLRDDDIEVVPVQELADLVARVETELSG